MVAGNIGMAHVNYTVLGNTVNTAQRIQSQAQARQILMGEELGGNSTTLLSASPCPVPVKNKAEPVTTYSLRGLYMDGEALLYVPCLIAEQQVAIIRRLSDGSFVLAASTRNQCRWAHTGSFTLKMNTTTFGTITLIASLPQQRNDSGLARSQIVLADNSLDGLLGENILTCEISWSDM